MAEFIEKHNISVVGGCCGTTPTHLEKLVQMVHGHPTPPRPEKQEAKLSSSITAVDMAQEPKVSFEKGLKPTIEWFKENLKQNGIKN